MHEMLKKSLRFAAVAALPLAAITLPVCAQSLCSPAGQSHALLLAASNSDRFNFAAAAADPFAAYVSSSSSASDAEAALPDAPSFQFSHKKKPKAAPDTDNGLPTPATRVYRNPNAPEIGQYTKYIPAGYTTKRQTLKQKEITGAEDLYSFGNVAGWFISAGWSHLNNSSPNYGTDRGAFGQRLGAAAIRSTSEGVFTDMVFAPLLHQDLRYYVKGPQYNVAYRSLYAASRVIIARRDSRSTTPNTALLAGYLATAGLTQAYYPSVNRGWNNFTSTYFSSLGGAVLSNIFSEFQTDILITLHLKKKTYQPFSPVK